MSDKNLLIGDTTYPHTPTFNLVETLRNFGNQCEIFDEAVVMRQAADRIEQLERELAEAKLSRLDEECLRIGQQIHRAAGNLPEMFNIVIDIENGYGGVKLFNNAGDELDFETDSDGLSYSIEKAINAAIQEGKA